MIDGMSVAQDLPEGYLIRDADPDRDAATCVEIYAPAITESGTSFEEVVPTAAEFAERIRKTQLAYPWLVMEDRGQVVGYAYASQHRVRAAYRWTVDSSVYVAKSHRRTGVARALYTELFARLKAKNIRVICAGVTLPNDASLGLHRSMGFETVGVYRGIGYKLGSWRDVMRLELELWPATNEQPPEPIGIERRQPRT